jgi:hypothetical protein
MNELDVRRCVRGVVGVEGGMLLCELGLSSLGGGVGAFFIFSISNQLDSSRRPKDFGHL